MKKLATGVWSENIDGIPVIINENTNTIRTKIPDGRTFTESYSQAPTIKDFIRFRENVLKAVKILKMLNR